MLVEYDLLASDVFWSLVDDPSGAKLTAAVARNTRRIRQEQKLTQQRLAELMTQHGHSMHQTTVAKLEAGSRPITVAELGALAFALGVSPMDFFDTRIPDEAEVALARLRAIEAALQARLAEVESSEAEIRNELIEAVELRESIEARLSAARDSEHEADLEAFYQDLESGKIDQHGVLRRNL